MSVERQAFGAEDAPGAPDDLFAAARLAWSRAYAPYSNFAVGAALRTVDGEIFAAANVENAAYPVGTCAEAGAIAAMVAAGKREIADVLILAESDTPLVPCGACCQRLAEFGGPDLPVHSANPDGPRAAFRLGDLLPHAFRFRGPAAPNAGSFGKTDP